MCGHGAGWALECPYPDPYPFKFAGNYPYPCPYPFKFAGNYPYPCPYPTMRAFTRPSWVFFAGVIGLGSNCHP